MINRFQYLFTLQYYKTAIKLSHRRNRRICQTRTWSLLRGFHLNDFIFRDMKLICYILNPEAPFVSLVSMNSWWNVHLVEVLALRQSVCASNVAICRLFLGEYLSSINLWLAKKHFVTSIALLLLVGITKITWEPYHGSREELGTLINLQIKFCRTDLNSTVITRDSRILFTGKGANISPTQPTITDSKCLILTMSTGAHIQILLSTLAFSRKTGTQVQ